MSDICVIVLVGLPGSGKTTFCEYALKPSFQFNCIHICYDELFTYLPSSSVLTFKQERIKVLEKIKQTIEHIKSNVIANHSKSENTVILCDDNNYYAGMRYEIYKICKEYHIAFAQVYFPIDLAVALTRNLKRSTGTLPVRVIEKMHSRLEKPSEKNQWERQTLIVDDSFDLKELEPFIRMCLVNPIKAAIVNKVVFEENPSIVHDMDLLLRKRIKEALKISEGNLNEKARVLNEKRKIILLELKTNGVGKDFNVDSVLERFALE